MAPGPLRVAMVTTFFPPHNFGGDGQYVRRLAHALARRGCEIEVIYDADAWRALARVDEGSPLPLQEEPAGVTVHRLESRWPTTSVLLTHQLGRPVVQRRQLAAILARGFDVIHYHNVSLVGGPGVLALGEGLKFYTAHEHWLVCPTHVLWRHNRERCTGRECLKCTLIHRRPPQLWRATGHLERHCAHVDVFIAPSRSVADNHRAFGFMREMTVMAPFVPDSELDAAIAAPVRSAARPYFLFVGRLEAMKGLQDVIVQFGDDIPADLLIAGSGTYEPLLRRLAADRPQVKFVGQKTTEELRSLYRGALALIVPSLGYETFGIVMIEAFCQSTPVIARRLGPFPQVVEESGGGMLFDDGDELRSALRRLAGDAALRERLGTLGRRAVEARWSEPVATNAYLELVRRTALARSRPDIAAKAERLTALNLAPER